MAAIGYRSFDGDDEVRVALGNLASQSAIGTWAFACRLTDDTHDGELVWTNGWVPLDIYFSDGSNAIRWNNGIDDRTGDAWAATDGFVIFVLRSNGSTDAQCSKAVYSGSSWGSWSHTTMSGVVGGGSFASSGDINIGTGCEWDVALIAKCSGVLTNSEVEALTGDLGDWQSMPGLTNLWRFDGQGGSDAVNDLVGTAAQSALTGTTLIAEGFPLAEAAGGGPVIRSVSLANSPNGSNKDDVAITLPAGAQVDDLLIIAPAHSIDNVTLAQAESMIPTADDVPVALATDSTYFLSGAVGRRKLTSGDISAGTIIVDWDSSADRGGQHATAILVCIENGTYDTTTPINAFNGALDTRNQVPSSGQTNVRVPSCTPTVDGCLLLAFIAKQGNSYQAPSPATLGGWTHLGCADTDWQSLNASSMVQTTAAATGVLDFPVQADDTGDQAWGIIIAIAPAGGGEPPTEGLLLAETGVALAVSPGIPLLVS